MDQNCYFNHTIAYLRLFRPIKGPNLCAPIYTFIGVFSGKKLPRKQVRNKDSEFGWVRNKDFWPKYLPRVVGK